MCVYIHALPYIYVGAAVPLWQGGFLNSWEGPQAVWTWPRVNLWAFCILELRRDHKRIPLRLRQIPLKAKSQRGEEAPSQTLNFPSLGRAQFAPGHCKGPQDQPQNSPSCPLSPWLSRTHVVHKETLEIPLWSLLSLPLGLSCGCSLVKLSEVVKQQKFSFQGSSVSVCSAGPAWDPLSPWIAVPRVLLSVHSKMKSVLTKSALHKWNIFSLLAGWVHTLKNRSRTVI